MCSSPEVSVEKNPSSTEFCHNYIKTEKVKDQNGVNLRQLLIQVTLAMRPSVTELVTK